MCRPGLLVLVASNSIVLLSRVLTALVPSDLSTAVKAVL